MEKIGVKKIDYIDFFSTKTLKKTNIKDRNLRLFIAYFINKIRLIDNV